MPDPNPSGKDPKHCLPCEGAVFAVAPAEAAKRIRAMHAWTLAGDGRKISADFVMKNFRAAADLITRIVEIAEKENHHPDIHLTDFRKLRIDLTTHAIGGLSENDFIVASEIDKLDKELKMPGV